MPKTEQKLEIYVRKQSKDRKNSSASIRVIV